MARSDVSAGTGAVPLDHPTDGGGVGRDRPQNEMRRQGSERGGKGGAAAMVIPHGVGAGRGDNIAVLRAEHAIGISLARGDSAGSIRRDGAHHGKEAHVIKSAQAEGIGPVEY